LELPRQIFSEINEYLKICGKEPVFNIQFVGTSKVVRLHGNLFTIQPDTTIKGLRSTDLIIIPAVYGDMEENLKNFKPLAHWITKQYKRGAEVASLCMGAFLLAETGLLNGRKCATHWVGANEFRLRFPEVKLVEDSIITDEAGIYSSGGGISFLNLIVYLVEKYVDRETAIYCSKFFQVDIDRVTQSPFIIFDGQKDHDDVQIKKAQEYIENNFGEKITIEQLAEMVSLGRRSLERRFKKATANTLNEYMQRVKIEAAKKFLENSSRKINDVMMEVGYSDTKTFRNSFRMITGLLPNEYRMKYNKRSGN
jgi:transcriptional regulator GlxA family with amidase domain